MGEGSSKTRIERSRTDTEASVLPQTGSVDSIADPTNLRPGAVDALPQESLCYVGLGSAVTCTYNGRETRLVKSIKQPATLDGYAFDLACKLESKRGKISDIRFLFTLCAGNEDDLLSWPFSKRVSLRIVDSANHGVDVPLEIHPEQDAECLRRPRAHAPQKGMLSKKISWKQVNKKKLVRDSFLTVAVQFQ